MHLLPAASPATILYAEDNKASRMALSLLLRDQGFRVLEAGTGREALRLAEERPDLILLDVHLPDADGFDLCRQFKALPAAASASVLLISGQYINTEDRIRGLEGGADGYLTKPVEPEEIFAQIKALLRVRQAEEALREAQAATERGLNRLKAVMSSMTDGLVVADASGNLLDWNPAALRLHGYASVEEVRRHLADFTAAFVLSLPDGTILPGSEWPMNRVLRGETLTDYELSVRRLDIGREWVVSYSGIPVRGTDGAVELAVLTLHDVTERRRAEAQLRQSAELLRGVAEGTTDAVFVKDRQGRYLLFNEAASRFVGKPVADVLGRDDSELFDPDGARFVMERDRRVMETGLAETEEETLTAAGVRRTYLSMKAPYRDGKGNIIGTIGVSRDITDRKREQEETARLARHLRLLMESAGEGIYGIDMQGRCTFINRAAAEMLGYDAEEVLGRVMHTLVHHSRKDGSRYPAEECPILLAYTKGQQTRVDDEIIWRKDGTYFPVHYTSHPIQKDGPQGAVVTFNDVTERSRAEESRRALQGERDEILRKLQTQNERMPLARVIFDADMRVTDWNPAAERIFGFRKEDLLGRNGFDHLVPSFARKEAQEVLDRLRAGDMNAHAINANLTKDGRTILCQWFNTPLLDETGRYIGLLSLVEDVTERVAAEEALKLRDRAIQAVTQGILISDPSRPDNPIIYASPGFERLTGYTAAEAVDRNCRFLQGPQTDPATAAELRGAIQEGKPCSVEILNYRKDGTPFWNALSISPVHDAENRPTHFVGVLTDINERRRLEEQYRQAQKMEAVGQLAGGVAHDFNNLLQVILGYGEMLLEVLPPEERARDMVGEMTKAGERAAALTRQLLTFSRQSVAAPTVLDVNAVVFDLEKMLRRVIGEDVTLSTNLAPGLGRVKADPGQLEQVVMNLVVNARDAMLQGGKLTIETTNTALGEEYTRLHKGVRPGLYVLLAVSDTGRGMTPAVQARIFEPFFTTKERGKGTGLGLATVFGIVQQSGGHVAVYSEPNVGTTFKVYLPRVEEAISPSKATVGEASALRGTETVLLVEDEDAVRALTRIVLQNGGYHILEAADGGEALNIASRHEETIHLLVSDVVMPILGGRQLAERLLALHPEMKVLFLSGYTDDAVVRHGILQETVHFLQKPFTPAALAQKVREVLDSPS